MLVDPWSVHQYAIWLLASGPRQLVYTWYWHNLATCQCFQPVNPCFTGTWLLASDPRQWIHMQLDYLPVVSICGFMCNLATCQWSASGYTLNLVPINGSICNLATCQWPQSVDPYATWLLAIGPSQLTGLLGPSLWIHVSLGYLSMVPVSGSMHNLTTRSQSVYPYSTWLLAKKSVSGSMCNFATKAQSTDSGIHRQPGNLTNVIGVNQSI